ncbi:hypothetical protein EOM81_08350 [bacterium]|nr:hypothetical protein [bacterium]
MYQIKTISSTDNRVYFQSEKLPTMAEAKKQLREHADFLVRNDLLDKLSKPQFLRDVQAAKSQYGVQVIIETPLITVRLINDGNTKADENQLADFIRQAKENAADHPGFPRYSIMPISHWTTGTGKYTKPRSLPRSARTADRNTKNPALQEFFSNRPRVQTVVFLNKEEL